MNLIDIYDKSDLKVKHASGEYKNLIISPEPDDIIHYFFSSRKKFIIVEEIIKYFGEEKKNQIIKSLEYLIDNGLMKHEPKVANQPITNIITDSKFSVNE